MVVVAHLADFDNEWVSEMAGKLREQYPALIESGRFHALHAPEELYPLLEVCPPFCAYKDDEKRVRWRSKQNIDYAFLMYYSVPLAPYYLQIEDDLQFAQQWVSKIVEFLALNYPASYLSADENAPWRVIDFSQLGFIGKMFQSNELIRMAQMLLLFYDQMPCDLLLGLWAKAMTQGKQIAYFKKHPSLFQHVGIFRTLGGYQTLQEKQFGRLLFDNPGATVLTTLTVVPSFDAKFAYFPHGEPENRKDVCDYEADAKLKASKTKICWFWAKSLMENQHLTLVFDLPVSIKAFLLDFGTENHPLDKLASGVVEVAAQAKGSKADVEALDRLEWCGDFQKVVNIAKEDQMIYWEKGASIPPELPITRPVRCLRITVTADQQEWMIIKQIQVRSL